MGNSDRLYRFRLFRFLTGCILLYPGLVLAQDQTFQIIVPGGLLEGSLREGDPGDSTLVILVAGSGPTDRNGNQPQGGSSNLRMLADGLENHGIASFRYDKRNIGKSAFSDLHEEDLRFDTIVGDLVRWIDHWKTGGRFTSIILAGHSEGSLVAILAARQRTVVKGLISLSGAGRPADQLIMKQLERQPEFVRVAADSLFRLVRQEKPADPPPFLMALFRPSVQAYLHSWITLDPSEELRQLEIPVLVVQGEQDLQVFSEDADRLAEAATNTSLLTISDMNHVFKKVADTADNIASYTEQDRPLHPDLIPGIINWIARFQQKTRR